MEAPPLERKLVAILAADVEGSASDLGAMRDPQDREAKLSFRQSVLESDNPASRQAYLDKCPDGEFKSLAEIRLGERGAAQMGSAAGPTR
jgi:hypothetical protein